jgi:hypothetical protein
MIINQIHSIGDILFLEPLFRNFIKVEGKSPVVPVRDHLMWLSEYIQSAELRPLSTFHWPYKNETTKHSDYLPLRWANQIYRGYELDDHHDFENMMPDKYLLAGLNPEMWTDINLMFNEKKSDSLMFKLGLVEPSGNIIDYVLVNENSQAGNVSINPKTDLPVIKMRFIEGFTLIDWHFVIMFAQENHHVSTSTFYLMQAIKNQYHFDSKVYIYPRPNNDGLRGISKLKTTYQYDTHN